MEAVSQIKPKYTQMEKENKKTKINKKDEFHRNIEKDFEKNCRFAAFGFEIGHAGKSFMGFVRIAML